ncbi:AraC family transcriptional regulator, partial [Streptomyces beijiangensis]|nr:AraC family transcriptional regulator [Streptomyces beijiangensis]
MPVARRRVTVIASPPVSMFNLAIPEMIFDKAEVDGGPGYETVICAPDPGPVTSTGGLDIHIPRGLEAVEGADTVIVAGAGVRQHFDARTVDAVRRAAA